MKSLLALLGILICAGSAMAEPIKVGCLYPLSGSGGLYGRDSLVAIEVALDELRRAEDPIAIEVEVRDSRSKTLRSLQIARRFVEDDNVDFLCGMVSSTVALTISEYAAQSKTFLIGTDHASPTLVEERLHPYYFRVTNGSRQSMRAGAKYIAETQANTPLRISFIGPDYDYGYQVYEDLRHFLEAEGVAHEVTSAYWPALFQTDYSLYIQQLMQDAPDIVVNAHWGLDLVTFVRQADQLGLFDQMQFMNFDTGGNYEILAELGADMPEGLVLSARHHLNWPPTEANARFVDEFQSRAGRYPSYAAQGAYSGIMAIAAAVRAAGGTDDADQLQHALENLSLSLPEDPEGFRSTMDPKHHQMLQVQAIGRTRPSSAFPPARMMLGDIHVYAPPATWPARRKED